MAHEINIDQLVDEHGDYLLAFAISKTNDRELSKDFVQDTLLAAIQHWDSFEGKSALRTWLTSILNRKIIDHWRKAETRYADPFSSFFKEGRGSWLPEKAPKHSVADFEVSMEREETYNELRECIDRLPEKWRYIIQSKYLKESKSEEICKEMEITSSNFWVIVHRSKLLLRDCLQQKWLR